VDFDDTLYTKAFVEIARKRLSFFKTMINSGIFRVIVVTARTQNISDIVDFCNSHDIRIDGIVSHAGTKLEILKSLNSIAHFEDSDKLVPFLAENGINCFYMGEYLSNSLKSEWKESLEKDGVWKYYVLDNNTRGL
jgi:hypothetical protein